MRVSLAYDRATLPVDLPDDRHIDVLEKRPVPAIADARAALRAALQTPIAAPPLTEMARGRPEYQMHSLAVSNFLEEARNATDSGSN